MQWSDVIRPPSDRHLRQFALMLVVFVLAIAGIRWFTGVAGSWTIGLSGAGGLIGIAGVISPVVVRPVYTGWMVVAFPIGWTVSRLMLASTFFAVITPIAVLFRLGGRDALRRRRQSSDTFWLPKRQAGSSAEYFRQS
jgi:hypothetical protein